MSARHVEAGRIGGLVASHRYSRDVRRDWGSLSRGSFFYGASEAAQRQRMRDVRAKREYLKRHGPEEGLRRWTAMVERHRAAFAGHGGEGVKTE